MFPGPKGANCSISRYSLGKTSPCLEGLMSSVVSVPSIPISLVCCSFVIVLETTSSKRFRKASTFSIFNESPAAYLWPPNCSSKSEHWSIAS